MLVDKWSSPIWTSPEYTWRTKMLFAMPQFFQQREYSSNIYEVKHTAFLFTMS